MKKSLIFWFAAVTCAAWILVGCESPTNGESGTDGKNVGFINDANVGAADLAALFKAADIVTLGPIVTTVEGVVPAGKKLAVSGETAVGDSSIDGSETLEIKSGGSVEVYGGAALTATAVSSGLIRGAAGSVYGDGTVVLPYVTAANAPNPNGVLVYNNSTAANKAAGSVTDGTVAPAVVSAVNVATLLAVVSPLTVYDLTSIVSTSIPAGKTLNLIGAGNTIASGLDLTSAGTLVVKEGAVLAATTYSVKGVTNNGTITSSATAAATQKDLISANSGSGTVVLSGTGDGVVHSGTLALTQNVVISGGSSKLIAPAVATPFSGGKTITVDEDGQLDFGTAAVTSIGATIVNEGWVLTGQTTTAALDTFFGLVTKGAIGASGNVTLSANWAVTRGDVGFTSIAAGNYTLTVGGAADKVAFTKATLTKAYASGDGTVEVGDTGTIVLANEGTIVVAGDGSVALPNSTFGAGTYTAAGEVTITAATAGDTIATAATASNGLTYLVASGDTIALTATGASAATYTLAAVNTSGDPITFSKESDKAAITIPGHASNTAANFTIPAAGTLVIGQGTNGGAVVLKHATNAGTLTTEANSVIKGIAIVNASSDGTDITISGITVTTAAAAQDLTAAAEDGSLTTTTGGTFKADGADATIAKSTSAKIGST